MDNKPTLINGQYADIDALLIKSGVLKKDGMIYASYMPTAHIQNLREVMEEYANQWKVKYNVLKAENEALKEKAEKMYWILDKILYDEGNTILYDDAEEAITALSTYSNKLSQERADLIREVNNRDLGENKEVE